jgi:hypothetical protein
MYDHGRKLELFARSGRDGWDSVGNEAMPSATRRVVPHKVGQNISAEQQAKAPPQERQGLLSSSV